MASVPFTVRDYQSSDFDAIWRIDQTCFPPGISYSRDELRFYMQRRNAFTLVAVDRESPRAESVLQAGKEVSPSAIAGFIVAEAGPRARGHIITIDVVSAARRFGVGSLLLGAAEDRLVSLKSTMVELETSVDNVTALSFYKRHGYSVVKTAPRYYSNGMDALVLEKSLSQ